MLLLSTKMCLIHQIGGAFTHKPEDLPIKLSPKAADLIKRAFEPLDPAKLLDHHVHIAGIGIGATGAFVNSKMRSWSHPFHRLKYKVYMSAAGVAAVANADRNFVQDRKSVV